MTDAAFHTVWLPLQERFYRIGFYMLEDQDEAKDALQDLYLKLWNLRASLDLVRQPSAYGALLMRNLCIDRIRRRQADVPMEDVLAEKAPPDEDLILRESVSELHAAIRKLPPSQRKLLSLRFLRGLSYEEIERETGLSGLNIRVQVSLARKKLKKLYENPR
jgi:RNA polymerase sigma-70 factor (ECF subfamily)